MPDTRIWDKNLQPQPCAHCPQQATGWTGPYGTYVCDDHNPRRAGRTLGEHASSRPTTPITDNPDEFARTLGITPEDGHHDEGPQPQRVHTPVTEGWTAVQVQVGSKRGHTIHASKRAAEKDARRLAKQSPNVEVWVCPVIDGKVIWPGGAR